MPGPFYFAWVDDTETEFDPVAHKREDEDVFAFDRTQDEGDFANLSVDIKNPRIGLLNAGRKTWAWLSFDTGTDLVPLFFGRLVGVPRNVFADVVTLDFTARPKDFVAQKLALAETLKVAPYYDPIFVALDKQDDPDIVLEARTALWHIDPVTGVVSISDILVGEDGTVEVQADQILDGSLDLTIGEIPARSVTMTATIPWNQTFSGSIDFTGYIRGNWPNEIQEEWPQPQVISSYTFKGLTDAWPKPGDSVGSGWSVAPGSELQNVSFLWKQELTLPDYLDSIPLPAPLPAGSLMFPPRISSGNYHAGVDGAGYNTSVDQVFVPIGWGVPKLILRYDADRDYSEVVTFKLNAAVQPIVTLPGEDESILMTINANAVSDFIGDEIPIGSVKRRTFINTERGQQALQHLVMIARANIASKARAISVGFTTDMLTGLDFTLRKNVLIHADKLPGGQAAGKVKSVRLSLDGGTGAALADIQFGCCIGYGGSYTEAPGDPTYAEETYCGNDYQVFTNRVDLLDTGDITINVDSYDPNDDGVDPGGMYLAKVLKTFDIFNPPATQRALMLAVGASDNEALDAVLQEHPTQIRLELVPLNAGPFETAIDVTVSDLIIPAQINLEAPSNA